MKPKIDILVRKRSGVGRKPLLNLCIKLFREFSKNRVLKTRCGGPYSDLSIVFVSKTKMHALNKKYRGRDYATDVLSFSPLDAGIGLGELVLCDAVIRSQAKEHGLSFKEELDYMVIHGFLHLLGYDHDGSRKEEIKMMRIQDRLFTRFSFKNSAKRNTKI